jgi:hypothetical protein
MDDTLSNRIRRRAREQRRPAAPGPCLVQPRGLCLPEGWLFALLVPAEADHRCSLLMVRDSAAGISDALGGALLDECALDGLPTHRCWVYLDIERRTRRLPPNRRLQQLAAALGWPRSQSGDWLGPALITGRDLYWADLDVPSVVLTAALPQD